VITRQGEDAVEAVRLPARHDIAVRLEGDGAGNRVAADGREDDATRAKGGIETAIGVEAGQGELVAAVRRRQRTPRHDNLAVSLYGTGQDGVQFQARGRDVGHHFATGAEGSVEAAVQVVAGEREMSLQPGSHVPGCHDLEYAVDRLQVQGPDLRAALREDSRDHAVVAESLVHTAVGAVAHDLKRAIVNILARDKNLAVGLEGDGVCTDAG